MAFRSSNRLRNAVYATGLVVLTAAFAFAPFYLTERERNRGVNLTTSPKALTGSQIMRGAYINSGSKDAGPDPDYDRATRSYKGRSLNNFAPTEADIAEHRQQMAAARAAAAKAEQ